MTNKNNTNKTLKLINDTLQFKGLVDVEYTVSVKENKIIIEVNDGLELTQSEIRENNVSKSHNKYKNANK